jgi:hypothetical protein
MITQFGTSANLMVVGQAARQGLALGFTDFVMPGIGAALATYALLVLAVTCSPEMAPFFGRVRSSKGRTNEAQQVQR